MRRRLQLTAAAVGVGAVLVAVVAAAGGPSRPGSAPAGARPAAGGLAAPTVPARIADCWVPDARGTVSLTLDEAGHLTTVAAETLGRPQRARRVRAEVERTLAVTPVQAVGVTASLRATPAPSA